MSEGIDHFVNEDFSKKTSMENNGFKGDAVAATANKPEYIELQQGQVHNNNVVEKEKPKFIFDSSGFTFEAGRLFRSEDMALCQLFIQSEAAFACVSAMGELGLVQFLDLNPDVSLFQRKFVLDVRRSEAMEQKLRFLEREMKREEIKAADMQDGLPRAPEEPREMAELEATFEKLEQELKEVNGNAVKLKQNFAELTELKHVLTSTNHFFEEKEEQDFGGQQQQLIPETEEVGFGGGGAAEGGIQLGFLAGVISRERLPAFEKMLWRACRGNMLLRQKEIGEKMEDPATGNPVKKSVFIVFFQGEQLKTRVEKICDGFHAKRYPCPDNTAERRDMAKGVLQRIDDLNTVLGQTNDQRRRILEIAAANINAWFVKVRKIKAVYHMLNLFNLDVTQNCFVAECWIATADIDPVQLILQREAEKAGASVLPVFNQMETKLTPPTFFRTNKYTSAFQTLINNYGVASYKEMNPAVYTIITFPFLFSVMFGDMGHGFIMMLFSFWMCWKEEELIKKKIDSEIWRIFFGGRYLIALMSVFSIYSGFIYNDLFSKSINIFGSSWHAYQNESAIVHTDFDMLSPGEHRAWYGTPYPFGTDPIWQVADNKIVFLNAFKMKLAIIVGVLQMLFGVILSLQNHRFFNHKISIYTEFIPQVLFLCFMFGYLAILMFHKWVSYYANNDSAHFDMSERCAPSILITFINMVLFKESEPTDKTCDAYMYSGQNGLQKFLVIVAVACIPIMLFGKPLYLRKLNKAKLAAEAMTVSANGSAGDKAAIVGQHEEEDAIEQVAVVHVDGPAAQSNGHGGQSAGHGGGHGADEEFEFGEVLILQMIHTIEYVLGSVSHTASYLRLWALSLAHAQLSEVLWNMVLRIGLSMKGWYGCFVLYAIFAMWAFCTVSILVLMEGLSAFLHCLRLHWVEFQSKFYHGEGYLFAPYSFRKILKQAEQV